MINIETKENLKEESDLQRQPNIDVSLIENNGELLFEMAKKEALNNGVMSQELWDHALYYAVQSENLSNCSDIYSYLSNFMVTSGFYFNSLLVLHAEDGHIYWKYSTSGMSSYATTGGGNKNVAYVTQ